MVSFKITIKGTAEIALKKLADKTQRLDAPMRESVMYLERITKTRFLSETDPDGGGWAALSPSTLAKKKTSAILRETSTLVSSIASSSTGKSGRVYASAAHGIYHQTGTNRMSQRKFLGISAEDISKITKIFEEHFK